MMKMMKNVALIIQPSYWYISSEFPPVLQRLAFVWSVILTVPPKMRKESSYSSETAWSIFLGNLVPEMHIVLIFSPCPFY